MRLRRELLVVAFVLACTNTVTPPGPAGVSGGAGGLAEAGASSVSGAPGGGKAAAGSGTAGSSMTSGGADAVGTAGTVTNGGSDGSGGNDGEAGEAGGPATGFPFSQAPTVLTKDAGYCWFEEPRALFVGDTLIVGNVASGWADANKRGDIEAIAYDVKTRQSTVTELHDRLELDDHDSPAFVRRPDGRLLTLYAKHGTENHFYYRVSSPGSLSTWDNERTFVPTAATKLTYSNLFLLTSEANRIYDFYRGLDDSYKPSFAYSDDAGETWKSGNVVINVPSTEKHRPYVRYASNGVDTIHLLYTEAHPRDYDNSLYHVSYRQGSLYRSDGTLVRSLAQGLTSPSEGSRIYQGDADHVAWGMDLKLDQAGRPVALYSVQVGSAGLPTGQGGDDIRYRYARWDGSTWRDNALAYGGSKLYSGEDDYSGLAVVDPSDTNVVFISTNADPVTGKPLLSAGDGLRHHELFRGETADGGQTWHWTAVTHDSTLDNLRPIAPPPGPAGQRALLWLRGKYRAYTDYQQELLAVLWTE
jgi:hypothetical protein